MIRSSDGKVRVDTGNTSLISNPKEQHAILLDHATKEARIVPLQGTPPQLGIPPMGPGVPSAPSPAAPPMKVQDLGKSFIEGHEVDGKRYIVQPPAASAAPPSPQGPQKPGLPTAPPVPTTVDVWTSSKLGLPVMTQVTGPFGQQTCVCKTAPTAEPHPGLFQIPPGYTPVVPPRS
jgi:hypothetical protein